MPDKHFRLSPSGLSRLSCSAAIQLGSEKDRHAGRAADEGTEAHAIAEGALLCDSNSPNNIAIQTYLDRVRQDRDEYCGELIEETLGPIADLPLGGTPDYLGWTPQRLDVIDLKYGTGVYVSPVENKQLGAYALLWRELFPELSSKVQTYRLVVVQPRQDNPIREWETNDEWLSDLYDDIRDAWTGPVEYHMGDHCRWCPLRQECPEIDAITQKTMVEGFGRSAELVDLAKMLAAAAAIKANLSDAHDRALTLAKQGETIEGYKRVESIGNSTWTIEDQEKLLAALKDRKIPATKATNRVVKSPTQLRKEYKDGRFDDLVFRPKRGELLVPLSDRRKAIVSDTLLFEDSKDGNPDCNA